MYCMKKLYECTSNYIIYVSEVPDWVPDVISGYPIFPIDNDIFNFADVVFKINRKLDTESFI